jgi:RHS repeat-associated protein
VTDTLSTAAQSSTPPTGAAGPALAGRNFGYQFDELGNRVTATQSSLTSTEQLTTSYQTNAANQYTTVNHPDPAQRIIHGSAHPQATVSASQQKVQPADGSLEPNSTALPVARQGAQFSTAATASPTSSPVQQQVAITATRPGVGKDGADVSQTRSGLHTFPPKQETLTYDLDGNLLTDAQWTYVWDAENRLIEMRRHPGLHPPLRLRFTYDHQGRRIRKIVEQHNGQSYALTSDTRFLYDGWNLVAEYQMNPSQHSSFDILHSFFWALDLSQTEQGAGGVGGLMLCSTASPAQPSQISNPSNLKYTAPVYDGNGNVLSLVSLSTNTITAHYEYSAFGETLEMEGGATEANPFRFSTKYTDDETGLVYYGYRYYSPELGRWPSRDPIEERGGSNLHGFMLNAALDRWDYLGFTACSCKCDSSQTDARDLLNERVNNSIQENGGKPQRIASDLIPNKRSRLTNRTDIESDLEDSGLGTDSGGPGQAKCIKLCGKCVGTDKVGHFFEEGRLYQRIDDEYGSGAGARWGEFAEGVGGARNPVVSGYPAGSLVSAGSLPTHTPTPHGVAGDHHTFGNPVGRADLAANKAGQDFWDRLRNDGSMMHFDICEYVSDSWDENLNPNTQR